MNTPRTIIHIIKTQHKTGKKAQKTEQSPKMRTSKWNLVNICVDKLIFSAIIKTWKFTNECSSDLYQRIKEYLKRVWRIYIMLFSSLPAFVSVYIPLVILGFFGIIFEKRIAEAEQRLFKKIKRAVRAKKRKAAVRAKRSVSTRPAAQKREQLKRAA